MKQLITLLLLWCGLSNALAQTTLLHCGHVLDVKKGKWLDGVTVRIEGNTIRSIEKGYLTPQEGEKVIDLRKHYVLPGLMDMHVHLETETNPNNTLERFILNPADIAYRSVNFARKTLMAGFTTVRDLGGTGVNISLRNAINAGLIDGPRVFTAGKSIATTGGHADPTNGYRKDLMGDPGPYEGVANGPDECRKAVRQRYKNGADLIKITATGGVLSLAKSGTAPQFTDEELRAIVETARDYGMKVAVHAHGAEGMKRALRAGVHSIEHGTYMDDEAIELFKKTGAYYVPTILAGRTVADSAKVPGYYAPIVVPKALAVGPQIQKTFAKAYKAGVKIAFGTDSGVSVHGLNAIEFELMVEAGMPPLEAIRSATLNAADLLGVDNLGSIEEGMLADIIAVQEDPLKNISTLRKVVFVMKDGKVYKNE
ncbi:imidazolonepropionase-like amidohydrolase [Thermonema lapsum]|uniref:Imidazolonepropionase-like amidohydrolase n=1 Tax=Thermonema lapsum TaxID=28195 RepID=A0A846MQ93_9BACT|nr:amidohydrolase family protein [Thermonema lapsum]NIK73530.1 imidazolonepropionase-like amidohydrolase [Thermonema lapsum]